MKTQEELDAKYKHEPEGPGDGWAGVNVAEDVDRYTVRCVGNDNAGYEARCQTLIAYVCYSGDDGDSESGPMTREFGYCEQHFAEWEARSAELDEWAAGLLDDPRIDC